jgi:hypothetical protein
MLTVLLSGLHTRSPHYTVPLVPTTPGRHNLSLPKALNLVPGSKHMYKPRQRPDLTSPLPLSDPNARSGPDSLTEDTCLLNTEC